MTNPKKQAIKAEMDRRGCRDCLFFDLRHKKYIPGMHNCFLNSLRNKDNADSLSRKNWKGCSACVYGQSRPCVSFCMKKLLREWQTGGAVTGKEVCIYA